MIIEKKILEYLHENDRGRFIDVSSVNLNYDELKSSVENLNSRKFIVLEQNKPRNFEAFGITNNRIRKINAKINSRGEEYLFCLNNSGNENCRKSKKNRFWKLAYFFG